MTGAASSKGRLFHDFDSYKNQEWLRRRKLRIEQVRKQSKDIAKALRQKVENEEKLKVKESEKIEEAKFRCWRAEKLDEMERKLRCALEEFGLGHKLAAAEPNPEEILEAKNKINMWKAQERGEVAKQEEIRKKKFEENVKLSSIQRRKMTRKFEDLRTALFRSVAAQKKLLQTRKCFDIWEVEENPDNIQRKTAENKKHKPEVDRRAPEVNKKSTTKFKKKSNNLLEQKQTFPELTNNIGSILSNKNEVKHTLNPSSFPAQKPETIWINLNDVQNSTVTSAGNSQTSKTTPNKSISQIKSEKLVEFYDFHSRYHCKTFREYPNLVEKIDSKTEPVIAEVLQSEQELEKLEAEKKQNAIIAREERGNEALKRERIKRNYNKLIAKLDDLNKKEKVIKVHKQIPPALIYMNDERLLERAKARQRIMNSKFESIYYTATAEMPPVEEPEIQSKLHINNFSNPSESNCSISRNAKASTEISFSPQNLKNNSPVTLSDASWTPVVKVVPKQAFRPVRKKKNKFKKKLLLDIDRALMEGRKLRETIMNDWEKTSVTQNDNPESSSDSETVKENFSKASPKASNSSENLQKSVQNQESQTDDFSNRNDLIREESKQKGELIDFGAQVGNHSLPLSASTSYKSPPSEITYNRINQFLDYLENCGETLEYINARNNPLYRRKMENALTDLLDELQSPIENRLLDFPCKDYSKPTLEYYILKLLNMSRECVADLSVSSDNNSTFNTVDFDYAKTCCQNEESDRESLSSYCSRIKSDELKKCEFQKPKILDEPNKNWKKVFENNKKEDVLVNEDTSSPKSNKITNSEKSPSELSINVIVEENVPSPITSRTHKFDTITEKCSKKISELTDLLTKVRQEKEVLLNSTSRVSGPVLSKRNRNFAESFSKIEEENIGELSSSNENQQEENINSKIITDFTKRCDSMVPPATEISSAFPDAIVESDEEHDQEESTVSTETLPDVMNELLRRKIITSPFKWCNNHTTELEAIREVPETTPSIESVICDFRKKISRIKPFSFAALDINKEYSDPSRENYISEVLGGGDDADNNLLNVRRSESDPIQREESWHSNLQTSSTESINNALTNLGLNWAKSFLKKIEESRAMSSSSCSDEENAELFSMSSTSSLRRKNY